MQGPPQASLAATDIACRRGDRLLFRGLSVSLAPGDVLHVTGTNGIGKSSLLRILGGLLRPFAGEIRREGAVGLVDERPALDEHLPLGQALRFWQRIDGASDRFGPWALDPLLDVPVRFLSTGQRKRAAFARLAAQAAPIWLLDEPLNGLDTNGVALVASAVAQHRASGGICLLASHQPFPLDGMQVLALAEFAG